VNFLAGPTGGSGRLFAPSRTLFAARVRVVGNPAATSVAAVDDTTIPMSRYTRVANWLDLCGISIPTSVTASG